MGILVSPGVSISVTDQGTASSAGSLSSAVVTKKKIPTPPTPSPTPPVASFTMSLASGYEPLTVQFTDTSTNSPTGWYWDFGTGDISTLQNPLYIFSLPGLYVVALDATNIDGTGQTTWPVVCNSYYLGTWDATTNLPHLVNGTGILSTRYIATAPGWQDFHGDNPISFAIGDMVVYDGSIWSVIRAGNPDLYINYYGNWDPQTNIPMLQDNDVPGDVGKQYKATSPGTVNFGHGDIDFYTNDYVIYNGSIWQRVPAYIEGPGLPFEIVVDTSYSTMVELPFNTYTSLTVDWGDSTVETITSGLPFQHTYGTVDIFTIMVDGYATTYGPAATSSAQLPIIALNSFGTYGLTSLFAGFSGAENLTTLPNYLPPTIINLDGMLEYATLFNQDISLWNTSNVTNMRGLFYGASSFNQPLESWNISNVTDISAMFLGTPFDQPLTFWQTGNVVYMSGVFQNTTAFNQFIGFWDTRKVIDMNGLFAGAVIYDQPLNTWDTSGVTTMEYLFTGALAFNQPLDLWNTSNVVNMDNAFANVVNFNQDISTWAVPLISTYPLNFALNSYLDPVTHPENSAKLPHWGI